MVPRETMTIGLGGGTVSLAHINRWGRDALEQVEQNKRTGRLDTDQKCHNITHQERCS